MQEIHDNGIQIYNGEIDEEDDSKEIKELRVQLLFPTTIHTHIQYTPLNYSVYRTRSL